MRYLTLALALCLALTVTAHADCRHYPVDGLFYRLACKHLVAESTDSQIVGGFWQDSRDLKDAAYRNNLEGYATSHDAPWALQYGTADDVWVMLNASEYRQRDILREVVKQMRARDSKNPCALLRCAASDTFGYGLVCGCGSSVSPCGCGK